MNKRIVSTILVLACLVATAFVLAAPGKAESAPLPTVAAVLPAPAPTPVIFETSSVLIIFEQPNAEQPSKPAPVARHKAPKAKTWTCGTWEDSQVGGAFKRCEWR